MLYNNDVTFRSEDYLPNTYVSYQTTENTGQSFTQVFYNSDNPLWDHQHETKLSTELLFQENKVDTNNNFIQFAFC